jgi:hypothetical protein
MSSNVCQVIHLINVIYVVNYLVRMIAYRHTLEDIQVIHLINVIDVVKDFAIILAYRDTFISHLSGLSPLCVLMCACKLEFTLNPLPHTYVHHIYKVYHTLEYIQVLHVHVINVIYVVKCLVEILIYKITLEYIRIWPRGFRGED